MNYNVETILSGIFGGAIIFGVILLLLTLSLIIVSTIAYWKLFTKAGKPGWASIIPFYNNWILIEIAELNWWWFLIVIATSIFSILEIDGLIEIAGIASFIASFNCYYNISKKFNKDNTFSIFAGIFNSIFVLILGLSKKEVYDKNVAVSPNGIFGQLDNSKNIDNNNHNMYTQNDSSVNTENVSFCGNCGTKLSFDSKFCPNCGKEKR